MGSFFAKLSNPRFGARPEFSDFSARFKRLINSEQDIVLNAPCYSPTAAREFLSSLKSHLITTLFLCGCLTDMSMYSIMLDAARSSCALHIVGDCLGYNDASKHALALDYARDSMCAQDITSAAILADLDAPHDTKATPADIQALLKAFEVDGPANQAGGEPEPPPTPANKPARVRSRAEHRRRKEKQKEEKRREEKQKEEDQKGEGKKEKSETPKDEGKGESEKEGSKAVPGDAAVSKEAVEAEVTATVPGEPPVQVPGQAPVPESGSIGAGPLWT
jgi:hypothetical protein